MNQINTWKGSLGSTVHRSDKNQYFKAREDEERSEGIELTSISLFSWKLDQGE